MKKFRHLEQVCLNVFSDVVLTNLLSRFAYSVSNDNYPLLFNIKNILDCTIHSLQQLLLARREIYDRTNLAISDNCPVSTKSCSSIKHQLQKCSIICQMPGIASCHVAA